MVCPLSWNDVSEIFKQTFQIRLANVLTQVIDEDKQKNGCHAD